MSGLNKYKIQSNTYKALLFFFCFVCIASYSKGQNRDLTDSLIRIYNNTALPDSLKLEILYSITFDHPNQDKKIFYANKLIEVAEKKENLLYLHRGFLQKGNAYRTKGDLDQAAYFIHKAIEVASEIDYKLGIGGAYLALADAYSINKNFNISTLYYKKSINIFRNLGDSISLASALMNAGDDFYRAHQFDSALTNFTTSLKIYQSLNFELGIGYNLGNIGLVYAKQGDYSQAEEKLKQATNILRSLGDIYPLTEYHLSIAEIYNSKNELEKALHYANLSLELAQQEGLKMQIQEASLKLSELYAQTKKFDSAYYYHTQYVAYRDSINNEEVIQEMADLRTEFEVSQKQAEIDLLTKQRQINKLIGLGLVFITVLLSILAFVLYRNNRSKQAINKILTSQKDELESQHLKLESLNHTKDRFFSIISHDLRGPVNAFNGISELIKHYIAKNEMAQLREVSEYLDKSARQLSTLLDNLLDWAIRQQGAFPFQAEKIHLNPLLQENAEMFGVTAHSKKITLTVNLEDEIFIWADRNSLNTIIRNLVNNALKFTEAEGLVTISAYTQKEYAMINIIDTGIGIPENKLENLFDLKEKNLSSGTAGEKGLGIGLNLAYEFALMNKGTIIVNSEENAGTIFTVKIPLHQTGFNKTRKRHGIEMIKEDETAR